MIKTRITSCSVAAFIAVIALSNPALARCCSGFWRCAAAVATAGASCGVQEARERIAEFIGRVERSRDTGKEQMEATLATMNQDAKVSCEGTHGQSVSLDEGVQTAKQRGDAAADTKGLSSDTQRAMNAGKAELANLQRESANSKFRSSAELVKANTARRRQISAMNSTFQATFVAPLTGLLAPLISASDPVTAAATLVAAARTLERIERRTEQVMAGTLDTFDQKIAPHIRKLTAERGAQEQREERAKQIADAMVELSQNQSEDKRRALEFLLNPGRTRPGLRRPTPRVERPQLDGRSIKKQLPAVTKTLSQDAAFARSVKIDKTFDRASADRTVEAELNQRLSGKTEKELKAQEEQLLAEARREFANDDKTTSALVKLIQTEARKRRQALKPKPTKPSKPKPAPDERPVPKPPIAKPIKPKPAPRTPPPTLPSKP